MRQALVIRSPPRSSDDEKIIAELQKSSVATIAESQGKSGVMDCGITPIQQGKCIAGRAITIHCFNADNLMLHVAVELTGRGDILVVSTNSKTMNGYFGELLASSYKMRGVVGLIIDGGTRDTDALRRMEFPVWSRYVSVVGTSKKNPGSVNVPIVCGGAYVSPGDFIVADDDGVVVVERKNALEVVRNAKEREAREIKTMQRIKSGELGIDFYGLRNIVKDLDISYFDTPDEVDK